MNKCPRCGKKLSIPQEVIINIESYSPNGSKIVSSGCCKMPVIVKQIVHYKVTPIKGTNVPEEDDWGSPIIPYIEKDDLLNELKEKLGLGDEELATSLYDMDAKRLSKLLKHIDSK